MRRSNTLPALLGVVVLAASIWVWVAVDPTTPPADARTAPAPAPAPDTATAAADAVQSPDTADVPTPPAASLPLPSSARGSAPDRGDPATFAVLTGCVRRLADGAPVVGVALEAEFSSPALVPEQSRAVTDAQGRYRFALAEDSTLVALIVPSTPETTRRTLADERPLRRGETVELDVGLPRGASLTGLVVDADARPVPHATVMGWTDPVWSVDNAPDRLAHPDRTVTADELGRFEIRGLGPPFVLSAEAPDQACRWRLRGELPEGSRTSGVTLQLGGARHAPGRVLGPRELPLAGVTMTARVPQSGTEGQPTGIDGVFRIDPAPRVEHTDGAGRFLLGPLADTLYEVTAQHPEHPPWHGHAAPDDSELLIRMARGATLTGQVRSARGAPVADAAVRVGSTGRGRLGERDGRATRTDAAGRFELAGLAADEHGLLTVAAAGYAIHVEQPLVLPVDADVAVSIVLDPERTLAGVVRDAAGAPIEDALVSLVGDRLVDTGGLTVVPPPTWEAQFAGLDRTLTDRDGRFRFDRLYAGRFELSIAHPTIADLAVTRTARSGGPELDVLLEPEAPDQLALVGRVTDARSGLPLESFTITPLALDGVLGPSGQSRSFSDAGGEFRIVGLAPGAWLINAAAEGYAPWSAPIRDYPAGERRFEVALTPSAALRLRVLDEAGRPARATLAFLDGQGRELFVSAEGRGGTARLDTDERGEALVLGLPAERITVRVTRGLLGESRDFPLDLSEPQPGFTELVLRRAADEPPRGPPGPR